MSAARRMTTSRAMSTGFIPPPLPPSPVDRVEKSFELDCTPCRARSCDAVSWESSKLPPRAYAARSSEADLLSSDIAGCGLLLTAEALRGCV